jgi:lipopolysaccharide heptosyltransferase I
MTPESNPLQHFLIIRLSSLGDIIHALPAFAALRTKFPESRISWVVEPKGKEILDLVSGLDEIIVLHKKRWWRDINRLKRRDRVALDFQGLVKSALLAYLSRAQKRIGFSRQNLREPLAAVFYTEKLEKISEDGHVAGKNLRLLTKLGIEETRLEFPLKISDDLREKVRSQFGKLGFSRDKKLVIYNLGAAWETKRWFPERWAEVIKAVNRADQFPLLLWGNDAERELALRVNAKTGVSLAPFLSVKEVFALLKEGALLISGDTFALQAACALGIPTVGIFGPTNPRRNGPFRCDDKVAYYEIECSLCYKKTCPTLECLKKITPEEVAAMALELLGENA